MGFAIDPDGTVYEAHGPTLVDRFSVLCRELGLSPGQACELFHSLPRGAQQAAWDDLERQLVPTGRPGR